MMNECLMKSLSAFIENVYGLGPSICEYDEIY